MHKFLKTIPSAAIFWNECKNLAFSISKKVKKLQSTKLLGPADAPKRMKKVLVDKSGVC